MRLCLQQLFPNLNGPQTHLSRAPPRVSDSEGLEWSLGNRTSNKLLGAAGPGTTFQERRQAKELNKNRIVRHRA